MFYFIFVLKVLGTVLITNTHYAEIYPYSIFASGGLLGNVIFLWVTGYLLVNIKQEKFFKWYTKRLKRIYPIVWIPTVIFLLLGFYSLKFMNIFEYFIFPTNYHFIGSIILLYIPYYLVMKYDILKKNIHRVALILFLLQFIIYLFLYDTTYYHIDVVREPMIWFIFFQALLLGAYFRLNNSYYISNFSRGDLFLMIFMLSLYLASKLFFLRNPNFSNLQLLNQVFLYFSMFYIVRVFIGLEDFFQKKLMRYKTVISYIASITLEIYVVQFVLIDQLNIFDFPFNFLLITTSIIIAASILHLIINVLKNSKKNITKRGVI